MHTRIVVIPILVAASFAVGSAAPTVTPGQGELEFAERLSDGFRVDAPGAVRREVLRPLTVDPRGRSRPGAVRGAATSLRISAAAMAGSVNTFALSPDGVTAVYIADQDTLGRFELYSAPVDGSVPPVKLSSGLAFGGGDQGVSLFLVTADSNHVVFLADPNLGGGFDELVSAPIDGSVAAVRLNVASEAPVTAVGLAPNGRVGYFGVGPSGAVELYGATVGSGGSGSRLTNVGAGNAAGDVVAADFSPDSSRVVFAADAATDNLFQWFSVSLTAGTPGSEVQLSNALSTVSLGAVSSDSSTVVYTGDDLTSQILDLFAVPLTGGTPIRLNPAHSGNGVSAIAISPDGTRVAYLADQNSIDVREVYGAQIDVAGSGIRLNTPLAPPQSADTLMISPDSTTVVYEADENLPGTVELYAVALDGSASPTTLHGVTPPDNVSFFSSIGTPVVGRRVVYPVIGGAVEVFSAPLDGTESSSAINDPLASGETLFHAFVPSSASRLMAFGVGLTADGTASRIYAGPVRTDLPSEQVNATAASGALGALMYEIDAAESRIVYLQDELSLGKPELFSRALDSDADGVVNAQDSCPFVENPTQSAVLFLQTVLAESQDRFVWGSLSELRWARGTLAEVGSYLPDVSGTLVDATSLVDDATPAVGAGFYYLFAPDCPGRSYQTTPGAEPARDAGALP